MNQLLFLIIVAFGYVQAKKTFNLPQYLNMSGVGCDYIEHFDLLFDDVTTQVKGSYNQDHGYYLLDGFKYYQQDVLNKLKACDVDKKTWQYSLNNIKLQRVTQNQIYLDQQATMGTVHAEELELQIFFEQYDSDLQVTEDFASRKQAMISIFFTTGFNNYSSFLPDGTEMLLPFTQINWNTGEGQNVETNPNRQFGLIQEYFDKYLGFQGTLGTTNLNVYFNKKKFYIPQYFVDTFFIPVSNLPTQLQTPPLLTVLSDSDVNDEMIKICYGTQEETILRQNYAVWLWVLGLLIWWTVMICTENDTDSVFSDEFRDNTLTMIPLYSMYKLNNETFFSKLSRQSLYLVYFAWEIVIISTLYGQFYVSRTYDVQDAIILWYALVAIVLAWPVGYFFGLMVYAAREQNKHKMQLEIDLKSITNKQTPEAEKLHGAVLEEENRLYTLWYTYYGLIYLAIFGCVLCSIWQMTFVDDDTQAYWVATIFVMLFIDQIVLDSISPFIIGRISKYRGYWFDADLARLWKHREES